MAKRVFLAGASGAIGRRLLPQLADAGYSVVGTTRSAGKMNLIAALGGKPTVLDALDSSAVAHAVARAKPDVIINQLTDLSAMMTASEERVIESNARLRKEATCNLIDAALANKVSFVVSQSIVWIYAPGQLPHHEGAELDVKAPGLRGISACGVATLEELTLRTRGIEGAVLRYGHFYGPGTWSADAAAQPAVHVDAAARATVLAVERNARGIFNIAEPNALIATDRAIAILRWDWRFRSQK